MFAFSRFGDNGTWEQHFLAGLGIGFWESQQAIVDAWRVDGHFVPSLDEDSVAKHVQAVARSNSSNLYSCVSRNY